MSCCPALPSHRVAARAPAQRMPLCCKASPPQKHHTSPTGMKIVKEKKNKNDYRLIRQSLSASAVTNCSVLTLP